LQALLDIVLPGTEQVGGVYLDQIAVPEWSRPMLEPVGDYVA